MIGVVIGGVFMFAIGWLANEGVATYERRKFPRKGAEFRALNRRVK